MSLECVFCKIIQGVLPATKVYEDSLVVAFMDLYPMRPGHVLVVPKEHHVSIRELTREMRAHVFEVGSEVANAQKMSGMDCKAHNFFINDGVAANQHVPHVHLHVLPRTGGDFHKALFSFASRYNSFFGAAEKRRRLERLAGDIANNMPTKIDVFRTNTDETLGA